MPYLKRGQGHFDNEYLVSWEGAHTLSGALIDTGVASNTYGNKIVRAGTVVAKVTNPTISSYNKLVVRKSPIDTGLFGQDVAVGVLMETVVITDSGELPNGRPVGYIIGGAALRASALFDNGQMGASSATKNALPTIDWV